MHAYLASSSRSNGSVLPPHPWDNKVSFAYAAKKCQVALIQFALCPGQAFDYLCLTNPLCNNQRSKGALHLQAGELRGFTLQQQANLLCLWVGLPN